MLDSPVPSLKGKHASVMQNLLQCGQGSSFFDDAKSTRKISDDLLSIKRGGRFFATQKNRQDTEKILTNLQEFHANRSDKS
jgi:hypothetical protein